MNRGQTPHLATYHSSFCATQSESLRAFSPFFAHCSATLRLLNLLFPILVPSLVLFSHACCFFHVGAFAKSKNYYFHTLASFLGLVSEPTRDHPLMVPHFSDKVSVVPELDLSCVIKRVAFVPWYCLASLISQAPFSRRWLCDVVLSMEDPLLCDRTSSFFSSSSASCAEAWVPPCPETIFHLWLELNIFLNDVPVS